ncbi:hypothetical protein ACHHYP_09496 [Achlya hypogyna]|uniref:F5/8 type C domain-containing protein n=1 Tax=Achlya hypogyna TaxID=1202772 RepID=A0A1V9YN20_ACHHY|nr:hypothetical protein ACHHYP_09496 [Achlya hypogyna]
MRALRQLWFGEMPLPVTPETATGVVAIRRRELAARLAVCTPQHERTWGSDVSALAEMLQDYLSALSEACAADDRAMWTWTHASLEAGPGLWPQGERAMVTLCLGFVSALEAEESDRLDQVSHATELWRTAAGHFAHAVQLVDDLLPHARVWQQLATVHAHASELRNVEATEASRTQLARYHSAVSRSGFAACMAASEAANALPAQTTLSQQLRWAVGAAKASCRATHWCNEAVIFLDSQQPQIALVFCDAVLKTKLPIPPQYPHRTCGIFTKLMHTAVAAHQEILAWALDEKARLKAAVVDSPALAYDRLERFLAIAPLTLTSLQPLPPDRPPTPEKTEQPEDGGRPPSRDVRVAEHARQLGISPTVPNGTWAYGVEPFEPSATSTGLLRGALSTPALPPRTLRPLTASTPQLRPLPDIAFETNHDSCHSHRSLSVYKRKNCGLCERAFPVANLPGEVVMRRILELRVFWGIESEKNPKHAPASFLYHTARVCLLCHDILSGAPTAEAGHALVTHRDATIQGHVGRLRKQSVRQLCLAETDEIGYMIHQSILNDALLLRAPGHVHRRRDLTRRPGVRATQSSSLLLGVAHNAIDPNSHRGIHTQEELGPWWEVDLGTHCAVSCVEVWNCVDSDPCVAERLFPCHIVLSMKPGGKRDLPTLEALGVDSVVVTDVVGPSTDRVGTQRHAQVQPVRWEPKAGSVARYVRIVANKWTYLHVERIHVFGSPVQQDADVKKKRPSTTKAATPTRFQHAESPLRPKSAGFLVATASSERRAQIGRDIRQQMESQ